MAAELVGGALLSATLQVVFDSLASREVVDYLRGKKLSDDLINNLKTVLSAVNAVLDDAEEKQITNPNVKQWLDELEDASYHADDLLDEIATHAFQSKLEAGSGTSISSKSIINFFSSSLNMYDRKMKKKLEEILKRLKFLEERIYVLGLINVVGEKPSPRPPTTSLIEEAEVFGRGGDKEAIIKLLLADDGDRNTVGVIPIKGMGGVGKTTLAQLVYNHDQVKEHFELKAWVCVSEEFDICKVTKTILYAVTKSHSSDNTDLDSLQIKLKEVLMGKKYLIVLDDVWNENYVTWENMSRPFKHGAQGSKILVTTRNESVAKIMQTVPTHYLEHLKDEDCWQLFAKHAFDDEDFSAHPVLEIIGRKIVKKCKGLPLAAKTLGGLLRSKVNVREWERILDSEIWQLSNNIPSALRLSYYYLPSHLKRCFAFCSIFPEDYEFQKHELVLLWMAENFLQHSNRNKRMEDVGYEYFNELVSRSFFQKADGGKESFIMRGLIHDLAKRASRNRCLTLSDDNSEEVLMVKVRHLAIGRSIPMERFNSIFEAACLRTFLPTSVYPFEYLSNEAMNHVILKLRCLRVLSMSGCRKLRQLPESIGEQRHLRHLDLSYTSIKRLPESVCLLYNLQTLNLSCCSNLIELPKDIYHLINLRHLDIRGCYKLEKMPRHISKLKSLQTLSTFIVGKDNAAKIGELRELQGLHGILALCNLNNVARAKDAMEAKLMDKKYLEELDLAWKDDANDEKNDIKVLENLLPHTNLKRLSIYGYGGTIFPNWLGDRSFCNIVFIRLSNCKYCNCLPPLGQLPSLRALHIEYLSGVVTVGAEFYGSSERKPFASLEILSFRYMSNWVKWCSIEVEDGEVFPKLQKLEITKCNRLMNVDWPPNLPCLSKLEIDGSVLVSLLPRTPAIRKLELGNWGGYFSFSCLVKVDLVYCKSCYCLPPLGQLPSLKKLHIQGFDRVERIGDEFYSTDTLSLSKPFKSLESLTFSHMLWWKEWSFLKSGVFLDLKQLTLYNCRKLNGKCFPNYLPSLKSLLISGCKQEVVASLSTDGLPLLSFLKIGHCKELESFPIRTLPANVDTIKIMGCKELLSLSEGGWPSKLKSLEISYCRKLFGNSLWWNLRTLTSLTSLQIIKIDEVVDSFPEEWQLPTTLKSLTLRHFRNLKSLSGKALQHHTSLKELKIEFCHHLHYLPEEGLPDSLSQLEIFGCGFLNGRCQKERGEDWPKISHIPHILIDCKEI